MVRKNGQAPRSKFKTSRNSKNKIERDTINSQIETSESPNEPQDGILDPVRMRFSAASSGVAFPRMLGINVDAGDAPRLHSFAWNVGIRSEPPIAHTDITQIVTFGILQRLADVYFERVHPIYGILSQEDFNERAIKRWSATRIGDDFDLVCCGVVALGSLFLFEPSNVQEAELVEHAKLTLESTVKFPTMDRITAWILRTLYLRLTTRPHIAWISSCVTMQLIEVVGIHQDVLTISVVHPQTSPMEERDVELQRRLFWVARSLNAFISYENGFSPVHLPTVTCKSILPRKDDYTHELMDLYLAWEKVYSQELSSRSSLEELLEIIQQIELHHDGLILHQTNLAFCIYRRLRLRNSKFSKKGLDILIAMGNDGLKAVHSMIYSYLPWWHIAMVPFQFVCVLLAIDSRDSLHYVGEAMQTLEAVTRKFDTHVMREALLTAGLLVRKWKKRKEEEIGFLEQGLAYQQTSTSNQQPGDISPTALEQPLCFEPTNFVLDMPDTSDINWDLFLGGPSTLFQASMQS